MVLERQCGDCGRKFSPKDFRGHNCGHICATCRAWFLTWAEVNDHKCSNYKVQVRAVEKRELRKQALKQVLFRGTYWLRFWAQLHRLEEDRKAIKEVCQAMEALAMRVFAYYE